MVNTLKGANEVTRRDFLGSAAASAGLALAGCVTGGGRAKSELPKFCKGALFHLGENMWHDYDYDPDGWAKSDKELEIHPNPKGPKGKSSRYHSYLRCRDDLWRRGIDRLAARKMNVVFIDLAEGMEYPSHPELQVKGTWSVEKMRAELDRIRSLGILPLPKLNFSTCHDAWLKDYHRMVSTRKYYEVVADLIRDTCEIFDCPPLFHIGFDEEIPAALENSFHMTIRQGDLWWHDLNYTIEQCEKNGARVTMWSDKICDGREEFLKRMTKNVVMSPWYYWPDIAKRAQTWDPELERKRGTWDVQMNLPNSFVVLSDNGFDLLACGSNVYVDDATEALVKFCRERLDPVHLMGIYTAPWSYMVPDKGKDGGHCISKALASVDQLADALVRHYPSSL